MPSGFSDYVDVDGERPKMLEGRAAELVSWVIEHQDIINALPHVELSFHAHGRSVTAKLATLFRQRDD